MVEQFPTFILNCCTYYKDYVFFYLFIFLDRVNTSGFNVLPIVLQAKDCMEPFQKDCMEPSRKAPYKGPLQTRSLVSAKGTDSSKTLYKLTHLWGNDGRKQFLQSWNKAL